MILLALLYVAGSGPADAGGPLEAEGTLASRLGIEVGEIVTARVELVEFSDGCMGFRATGIDCEGLAAVTDGNVTWLVVGDEAYRYHGSHRFRALRFAEGPFPAEQGRPCAAAGRHAPPEGTTVVALPATRYRVRGARGLAAGKRWHGLGGRVGGGADPARLALTTRVVSRG